MTKSNFSKLSEQALFAHPPLSTELNVPGLGAIRGRDGRSARRTGRTEQFATVVSKEFKVWMKVQAKKAGKSQAALLDDMQAGCRCAGASMRARRRSTSHSRQAFSGSS